MTVDWPQITTAVVGFIAGALIKGLLDLHIGVQLVRILSGIPSRWLFRNAYPPLSGQWENNWRGGGSETYRSETDRHSHPIVYQFGPYIYSVYINQGRRFALFGKLRGEYIVADWFDVEDRFGYFGACQLRVDSSDQLSGIWIGHSKKTQVIRSDEFLWKKIR